MAIRSEDLAAANEKAMNALNRQNESLRNMSMINGGIMGQPARRAEHYALDIVKSLPMDRDLALDALDRARAMVEAMHRDAS